MKLARYGSARDNAYRQSNTIIVAALQIATYEGSFLLAKFATLARCVEPRRCTKQVEERTCTLADRFNEIRYHLLCL